MREILFRGKAANRIKGRAYRTKYKNGDWVYGLLTDNENYAGFAEMTNTSGISGIEVDKNTVGQYTGLTDKNDVKIFEGDIIKDNWVVSYVTGYGENLGLAAGWYLQRDNFESYIELECYPEKYEVIGNIYDNPELL